MTRIYLPFMIISIVMSLNSCANLTQLLSNMQVRKPTARITAAEITGVTFNELDMVFDIEINNPNNIGVKMAGFDYQLQINSITFIQGDEKNALQVAEQSKSIITIPVKLVFANLYDLIAATKNQDSTTYSFSCGLTFNMPVLGNLRLPLSHTGRLPLIKLPSISLKNIEMSKIGLTGAELILHIGIKNPNSILLRLNELNYSLDIGGQNWARGNSGAVNEISNRSESILSIPVVLNFLGMSRNIFGILNGSSNLDYRLTGDLYLGTSWKLLNNIKLSFDESGQVPLLK